MNEGTTHGDRITADLGGSHVQGQIVFGSKNVQTQTARDMTIQVTQAEMAELRQHFADLRARLATEVPADKKDAALERFDELERAVVADKPDLTTMQYVGNWFRNNLPHVAGSVVSLVVHPIVGKLVEAAGVAAAEQLTELFGAGD